MSPLACIRTNHSLGVKLQNMRHFQLPFVLGCHRWRFVGCWRRRCTPWSTPWSHNNSAIPWHSWHFHFCLLLSLFLWPLGRRTMHFQTALMLHNWDSCNRGWGIRCNLRQCHSNFPHPDLATRPWSPQGNVPPLAVSAPCRSHSSAIYRQNVGFHTGFSVLTCSTQPPSYYTFTQHSHHWDHNSPKTSSISYCRREPFTLINSYSKYPLSTIWQLTRASQETYEGRRSSCRWRSHYSQKPTVVMLASSQSILHWRRRAVAAWRRGQKRRSRY